MANTTGRKFGGRQAGTPNRTTYEMRQFIKTFLERQFENLDEIFDELKPKDKVNVILKIFPYVLSKQMLMEDPPQEPTERYDLSALTDEEASQLETIFQKIKINGGKGEQVYRD